MQFSMIAQSTLVTDSTRPRKFQTFHDPSILSFARHRPLPDRNMALKSVAVPLYGLSHQLYHSCDITKERFLDQRALEELSEQKKDDLFSFLGSFWTG